MIDEAEILARWLSPESLEESWHPVFFHSKYDDLDRALRKSPLRFRPLGDFVEVASGEPINPGDLDEAEWKVVFGADSIEIERSSGMAESQAIYWLPPEAIILSRAPQSHLASSYWNERTLTGRGFISGYGLVLKPKGPESIGWLINELRSRFCLLQVERSLSCSSPSHIITPQLMLRIRVDYPQAEERIRLNQSAQEELLKVIVHHQAKATFSEAQQTIRPFLLTGSTFEERITQFEEYLLQQQAAEVERGFFVEASTSDPDLDLFALRPLRGTAGIERISKPIRLQPQDDPDVNRNWREWYWDGSAEKPIRVFNSLMVGSVLPSHLLARMIALRANVETFQPLNRSILPSFSFFEDIVEAHRHHGKLNEEEVARDLVRQWLTMHRSLSQKPALIELASLYDIRSDSDWLAIEQNEEFATVLCNCFREIFRPILALKVIHDGRVVGVYLLLGHDQVDDPERAKAHLEGIGSRLAVFLYQASEFFSEAAKRESLRRLSSVMHQINGPTGRAATALGDLFDFLKGHPEIGSALVPDDLKAARRAEMNREALEAYTLEARLRDLQKAIEDIRKVSYQVRRLKWVQGDIPFEKVDLRAAIQERLAACSRQIPGLKLEPKCIDEGLFVHGNQEALSMALEEVISNACRELREHDVGQPEILLQVTCHHGQIVLQVKDNALPIEAQLLSDPFEEGASLYARSGRGSGLGLAIVRETFHKHGGSCRLYENRDEMRQRLPGVTFEGILPLENE